MLDKCPKCGAAVKGPTEMFCSSCAEPLFSHDGPGAEKPETPAAPYQVAVPYPAAPRLPVPSPVSYGRGATPGAAYRKRARVRNGIFITAAIALVAAIFVGGGYLMFKPAETMEYMSLPKPVDWVEAGKEERESLQAQLRLRQSKIVVDYYYSSPGGETRLVVLEYPAADTDLSIPETDDPGEVQSYIEENRSSIEVFIRSAEPSVLSIEIQPVEFACGNVAIGIVYENAGDASHEKAKTEMLLFNRDDYIYQVLIVDSTIVNAAGIRAFVAQNMEFE